MTIPIPLSRSRSLPKTIASLPAVLCVPGAWQFDMLQHRQHVLGRLQQARHGEVPAERGHPRAQAVAAQVEGEPGDKPRQRRPAHQDLPPVSGGGSCRGER